MALPPFATVNDLAAWTGQVIMPADAARAEAVLSAASALVRTHTGATWVVDGELSDVPDIVPVVVVQVAGRVWANPDGLTSVTLDDGTRRWESGTTGLYLTDSEKDMLGGLVTTDASRSVGVLSTTRGEGRGDTIYVPTGPPPSGPPFPWYSSEDL